MPTIAHVLLLSLSLGFLPDPPPVTGVVVDGSGRPVPRAIVQTLSRDGHAAASVFTDTRGEFRIPSVEGCRVQAALSGFEPASADCRTDAPVRLVLAVAPVAEDIVVSATRTEAPSGQVAASVTVFDAADIERRQQPLLADLLREAPGSPSCKAAHRGR